MKTLGVEIHIHRDAEITEAPERTEYFGNHYEVLLPVGKDHTMSLIIDEDALTELRKMGNENPWKKVGVI